MVIEYERDRFQFSSEAVIKTWLTVSEWRLSWGIRVHKKKLMIAQ